MLLELSQALYVHSTAQILAQNRLFPQKTTTQKFFGGAEDMSCYKKISFSYFRWMEEYSFPQSSHVSVWRNQKMRPPQD